MHPEDLQAARQRLAEVWVPFDERFTGQQDAGRNLDTTLASPPPPDGELPHALEIQVAIMTRSVELVEASRQASESAKARWAAAATTDTSILCRVTGLPHSWKKGGYHDKTKKPLKKCRHCLTTRTLREGDVLDPTRRGRAA